MRCKARRARTRLARSAGASPRCSPQWPAICGCTPPHGRCCHRLLLRRRRRRRRCGRRVCCTLPTARLLCRMLRLLAVARTCGAGSWRCSRLLAAGGSRQRTCILQAAAVDQQVVLPRPLAQRQQAHPAGRTPGAGAERHAPPAGAALAVNARHECATGARRAAAVPTSQARTSQNEQHSRGRGVPKHP